MTVDHIGNDRADNVADFGLMVVDPAVIDTRRNFSGACGQCVSCGSRAS